MITPIQQLISTVEQHTQLEDSKLWWADLKKELLEKEKQLIIDAYRTGYVESLTADWYPDKHAKEHYEGLFKEDIESPPRKRLG